MMAVEMAVLYVGLVGLVGYVGCKVADRLDGESL